MKLRKEGVRVIVLALQHELLYSPSIATRLHLELQKQGIFSKKSELIDSEWTEVHLPKLDDSDLDFLANKSDGAIKCIKTENFTKGVELSAKRWRKSFTNKL